MSRRRLPRPSVVLPPALLVVMATMAALVFATQTPTRTVLVQARVWLVVLVVGVMGAIAMAVPEVLARRSARAWARMAEAASRAAAEDHRRFLLRLDHELKNPVTAIQAGLANLELTTQDSGGCCRQDAAVRPTLEGIAAQTRRLADLVADLRKLAELETRPLERSPVDLGELLCEVGETVGELPGAADPRVSLSLPQAPWPVGTVPGDHDLLSVAFHNLLANAVKFTTPCDRIEVRAHEDGDWVVVEVADTGSGIPPGELPHIWEELARGSAARGTPGMGLGLALVKSVVTRHGGSVWARSRLGEGTVVGVRLPTR